MDGLRSLVCVTVSVWSLTHCVTGRSIGAVRFEIPAERLKASGACMSSLLLWGFVRACSSTVKHVTGVVASAQRWLDTAIRKARRSLQGTVSIIRWVGLGSDRRVFLQPVPGPTCGRVGSGRMGVRVG